MAVWSVVRAFGQWLVGRWSVVGGRLVGGFKKTPLQMAQQLKAKNINVVSRQLFCRQCKAKFLLETDSLY